MSSRVENILEDTLDGVLYDKKPQSRVEELLSELNASGGTGGGGAPGKNGKSAYELAVENGFKGTEQEWQDSINWQDDVMSADDARSLVQSIFKKGE